MTLPPPPNTRTAALAGWLLHALGEELGTSVGGPVSTTLIAPGGRPPPADWCCNDADDAQGMAWARIDARYPTDRFPAVSASTSRCGTHVAAIVELGVYRCAHTLDEQGRPPDPGDVTADALMIDADSYALHAAVCRLRWPYVLGGWSSLGPSGGIVGGLLSVTVLLSQGPIGKEL